MTVGFHPIEKDPVVAYYPFVGAEYPPTHQLRRSMKKGGEPVVVKGCEGMEGTFATRKGTENSDPDAGNLTVIATKRAMRITDHGWDAVITSSGKGTFLIRRRKDALSSQCPFFGYEVRCIAANSHLGQETERQSGGDVVTRQPAAAMVAACAFHSPPRGCDRDERGTP